MDETRCSFFPSMPTAAILLIFLIMPLSAFSSSSVYILGSQLSTTRKLLQAQQSCPVNFELANYTVLTSKCKGPLYPPATCCSALKESACPYAGDLNNLNNDCTMTMFSYINLNGNTHQGFLLMNARRAS